MRKSSHCFCGKYSIFGLYFDRKEVVKVMIIDELEKKVQGKGVRIVFTEGWDPRVQKAAID